MATDADLRTYTIADATVAAITTRWFVNSVPEFADLPFVYCRRARTVFRDIMGERDIEAEYFDVECASDDLDEAISLADAVRDRLEGASGTIGSGSYACVQVADQFDEYVPRVQAADETLHVISLVVEVTH